MIKFIWAYGITLVVFLGCDSVWLGIMGQALYKPILGDILLPTFKPVPALLFYVLYLAGIMIFAVKPAFDSGRWSDATIYGALFGFFCYATYDLTNMATLRNWSLPLTLADLAWGSFLTGLSATAGYVLSSLALRLFKIGL